jgi:hypothetical protein
MTSRAIVCSLLSLVLAFSISDTLAQARRQSAITQFGRLHVVQQGRDGSPTGPPTGEYLYLESDKILGDGATYISIEGVFNSGASVIALIGENAGGNQSRTIYRVVVLRSDRAKVYKNDEFVSDDDHKIEPVLEQGMLQVPLGYSSGKRKIATFDGTRLVVQKESVIGKTIAVEKNTCEGLFEQNLKECISVHGAFSTSLQEYVDDARHNPAFDEEAFYAYCEQAWNAKAQPARVEFQKAVCGPKLITASAIHAKQPSNCDTVREEIDAKLRKKGISGYSLFIVESDKLDGNQVVVGTCDRGAKRITYLRGDVRPLAPDADRGGASLSGKLRDVCYVSAPSSWSFETSEMSGGTTVMPPKSDPLGQQNFELFVYPGLMKVVAPITGADQPVSARVHANRVDADSEKLREVTIRRANGFRGQEESTRVYVTSSRTRKELRLYIDFVDESNRAIPVGGEVPFVGARCTAANTMSPKSFGDICWRLIEAMSLKSWFGPRACDIQGDRMVRVK